MIPSEIENQILAKRVIYNMLGSKGLNKIMCALMLCNFKCALFLNRE